MATNTDLIRDQLTELFAQHAKLGRGKVRVVSGDLHNDVRFNEGSHPNQMPSVCNIMHEFCKATDKVIHETPSGRSSTLSIEYMLPR